jgi:hypothetical protein
MFPTVLTSLLRLLYLLLLAALLFACDPSVVTYYYSISTRFGDPAVGLATLVSVGVP